MSVWSNPCYTLDPLWKAARMSTSDIATKPPDSFSYLLEKKYANPSGKYAAYRGKTYGDFFKDKPNQWKLFVRATQANRKVPTKQQKKFDHTIENLKPKYSGIQAVYWATSKVWKQQWTFKDELQVEPKLEFIKEALICNHHMSRLPGKKNLKDIDLIIMRLKKNERFLYLANAKESMDHIWAYKYNRSYLRRVSKDAEGNSMYPYTMVPNKFGRLKVTNFQLGYFLTDTKTNETGIFFWKDHERIINTINAIMNLYMYFALYDIDNDKLSKTMLNKYVQIMDLIVDSMSKLDTDGCNKLCRALDVACNIFIATLSLDYNTRGLDDQKEKVVREELGDIIDINKLLNIAQGNDMGLTESFELLKVYKLLPCPDFCPYSVVRNLEEKMNPKNDFNMDFNKEIVDSSGRTFNLECSLDELKAYAKRSKIITFLNKHKRFPGVLYDPETAPIELLGYPNVRESCIKVNNVQHINIEGAFQYKRFDMCEHELVKDKTTAQPRDRIRSAKVGGNQVLQYLFDKGFMPQSDVRGCIEKDTIPWKKDIQLALKPEAKKPMARTFFMLPDPPRRILSEFENNLASYVQHKNGSSQGKNDMDMDRKLFDITTWEKDGYQPVILSFDLASFSGSMNIKFKEFGLEAWAEAFGESWIPKLKDIFTKYKLKWDKFNISEELQLTGDDMEGFNGRLNTDIHLDIMGYAIYKLRQMGLIDTGGKMECLIDDGLLALMVKEADFNRVVGVIIQIIEAIYNGASLKISWDKTYVSSYTCQYLNRVFVYGEEITGGAKAFLRIGKLNEAPIPTIMDHLEAHAASSRGAIKAGCDHRIVYFKYLWEVTMTIFKWSRSVKDLKFSTNLCLSLFTPVGLGGFGISSVYSLSSNQTYDPFNQCLGNMVILSRCVPSLAPFIDMRVNAPMRDMSCEGVLSAPRSMRYVYRTLNTRRFANMARDIILKTSVNQFIKEVADAIKDTTGSMVIDTFCSMSVIHDVVRNALWRIDPMNTLEKIVGKLQNSNTAAYVIGWKQRIAITLANASEARQLIKENSKGLMILRA